MPNAPHKTILLVARGLDPVGTGRQIELVAEGLAAAGWDVHLATSTAGGSLPQRIAALGGTVHSIGRRPVVDLAVGARLTSLALRLRPAVLMAWGRALLPAAAAARLALSGVRVVGHMAKPMRGAATAWSLARLDRVIVTSPGVAASCRRLGLPDRRIELILPGIAPAAGGGLWRADVAARLGLNPEKIWTLAVAPLRVESRLDRLLWAIDQLGVVHKGVEHVLVGAGPLLRHVQRRARVQELAERLFVVPHCDVLPDLVGQVRLVWQSGSVAFGGAILDAMARGIPAVAVESDAARQLIVDQETGRIVPAVPESELPRRAFGLVEDESLATRYGNAARARAASLFPAAAMVAAHVSLCESLAASRRERIAD